ncbi:MAG TPA: N-formylglutamate deformylase [Casimicrobiaceae bacterium]|nr:N-formylglutamate deformylase [Casimicrobiaceae bacterium]
MNDIYTLFRGSRPLIVSMPHVGTAIPDDLRKHFVDEALHTPDTDWHLDALYAFVKDEGASLIVPAMSRYVIDLNRPADDKPMYAGANNTELCPTRSFEGTPLYQSSRAPDAAEIARRRATYWHPYHEALTREIERVRSTHGHAIVFDAHSIRSELPWLFEGKLPDLNLGTSNGASCAPSLREALSRVLATQTRYTYAVDGRFKGGYITRHYGQPELAVHAIQLEMCWSCYMVEAPPYRVDPMRADELRSVLTPLIGAMLDWRPDVR